MAGRAFFRRGLVEENGFPLHHARQLVATCAEDFAMRALQREGGPHIVIESGGLPFRAVVTLGTGRFA